MDSDSETSVEHDKPLDLTPPLPSLSTDARLGSSAQSHFDPAQALSIERFLLGSLRHNNSIPALATSAASTLAPGEDFIRGPGGTLDNNSFLSIHDHILHGPFDAEEPMAEEMISLQPSAERAQVPLPTSSVSIPLATAKEPPVVKSMDTAAMLQTGETPMTTEPLAIWTAMRAQREYPQQQPQQQQVQLEHQQQQQQQVQLEHLQQQQQRQLEHHQQQQQRQWQLEQQQQQQQQQGQRQLEHYQQQQRPRQLELQQQQPVRGAPFCDMNEPGNAAARLTRDNSPRSAPRGSPTFLMRALSGSEASIDPEVDRLTSHAHQMIRSPVQMQQAQEGYAFAMPQQQFRGLKRSYSSSDIAVHQGQIKSPCSAHSGTRLFPVYRQGGRPLSDHMPAAGATGRGTTSPEWSNTWDRVRREQHAANDRRNDPILPPDQNRCTWKRTGMHRLMASDLSTRRVGAFSDIGTVYPKAHSMAYAASSGGHPTRLAVEGSGFMDPTTCHSGVAVSDHLPGRHIRVRAKATNRASPELATLSTGSPPPSGSVTPQGALTPAPSGALRGMNVADRQDILSLSASNMRPLGPSAISPRMGQADDIFLNLFDTKRKEKLRPPSLFATEAAQPSLKAHESAPPCASKGQNNVSVDSHGNGGGGGGGGNDGPSPNNGKGNGKGGAKKKLVTREEDGYESGHNYKKTALHTIPWDQRAFIPVTGFGTKTFSIFSAPLFWEKMDWTVRASLFTVLPVMILALEPATEYIFPLPASAAVLAFWITMPTFGSGLHEFFIALKGYALSLVILMIIITIPPKSTWVILLLIFVLVLLISFFAEEVKKTCAYCITVFLMRLQANPSDTGFKFVGDYFLTLFIALAFGLAAFFIPNIRWSSDLSKKYVSLLGNSLSICVQGMCSSFWACSSIDRELNLVRLRQLRSTAMRASAKASKYFAEAGYEPHTGTFMATISTRQEFLHNIFDTLSSMIQVIELINDDPRRIDTPLCVSFGAAIEEDLAIIASAMDNMILKITDFEHLVKEEDVVFFCEARQRFQDRISEVRQEVILNNEMYETDESDVLLGFFLFSVDELCETISNFSQEKNPASTFRSWITAPIRDCKSSYHALCYLITYFIQHRSITRRLKEAIKLALCMTVPCIFQIYALDNRSTSPVAGAAIIAFVYNQTGAQSFTYAVNRVLGTVLGSLLALLAVQLSHGERWILYIAVGVLSFVGAYVQTSRDFTTAGNAVCTSVISIITQYKDEGAALVRIQQNVFAILIYFSITTVLWPMRANVKIHLGLDLSLRCFRESACRLLRNLDMPEDVNEVNTSVIDVLEQWQSKIGQQSTFLCGAIAEPTLVGAEFPETSWRKLIEAQQGLWSIVYMMRYAYFTFMSSKADGETELSVHWVVLRRISPFARDLCDLIYAAVDLYLLSLCKTTVVPTSHLTRLRHGILDVEQRIVEVFIQTVCRKLGGDTSSNEGDKDSDRMATSFTGLIPPSVGGDVSGRAGANLNPPSLVGLPNPQHSSKSIDNTGRGHNNDSKSTKGPPPMIANEASTPKRKKGGYLMYNLTAEEEEELRKQLSRRSIVGRRRGFACQYEEDKDSEGDKPKNLECTRLFKPPPRTSFAIPGSVDDNFNEDEFTDKKNDKSWHKSFHDSFSKNHSFFSFLTRMRNNSVAEDANKEDGDKSKRKHGDTGKSVEGANSPEDSLPHLKACQSEKVVVEGLGPKVEMVERLSPPEETTLVGKSPSNPETVGRTAGACLFSIPDADVAKPPTTEKPPRQSRREGGRSSSSFATSVLEHQWSSVGDKASIEPRNHVEQLLAQIDFFDAEKKEFVLSNQDIHSLEAFLFGVRALTVQLGELQKSLLEMQHSEELARKV